MDINLFRSLRTLTQVGLTIIYVGMAFLFFAFITLLVSIWVKEAISALILLYGIAGACLFLGLFGVLISESL